VYPFGLAVATFFLVLGGPALAADKGKAEGPTAPKAAAVPPAAPVQGKPASQPVKGTAAQAKRCDKLKGEAQDRCLEEVRASILEVDRKNRVADAARKTPGSKGAAKSAEGPQKAKAGGAKAPAAGANEQVGDQRTQRESPRVTREKNK
jgi:type IV secretory pathway VirB10-like protein